MDKNAGVLKPYILSGKPKPEQVRVKVFLGFDPSHLIFFCRSK
jgi:hypothetical protein